MRLLRGDADRAVVGVAGPHRDAADGLQRGIRDRDGVRAQRQRLDEVGRCAQAAGDDQGHVGAAEAVEVAPGAGQRGDGGHRDVVAEDGGRGAGAAAAAVQDDVVDPDLECRVDVLLDVLCRELVADRDAASAVPHLGRELADLVRVGPVWKARRGDGRLADLQPLVTVAVPDTTTQCSERWR